MNTSKISIVTPSFNQGHLIEKTILSVVEQGIPNVEYIIIDGASIDNTVDVIKKYESKLKYWVSEVDGGQTEAINKGLRHVTGDIWAYICSDDTYNPGAFAKCIEVFQDKRVDVVFGGCNFIDINDVVTREKQPGQFDRAKLLRNNYIYQPSVFMRRSILDEHGPFDESLHFSMDYEYWVRISQKARFQYVDFIFSNYRLHSSSKSMKAVSGMNEEGRAVKKKYGAGVRADITYYNFKFWGQHYYQAKRKFFDAISKGNQHNAHIAQ